MKKILLYHFILCFLIVPVKVYGVSFNPDFIADVSGYTGSNPAPFIPVQAASGTLPQPIEPLQDIQPVNQNIQEELKPFIQQYLIDTGRSLDILPRVVENISSLVSENIYSIQDITNILSNDLTPQIEPDIAVFLKQETLESLI